MEKLIIKYYFPAIIFLLMGLLCIEALLTLWIVISSKQIIEKLVLWFIINFLIFGSFELIFRVMYKHFTGLKYQLIPKFSYKNVYIEPHPYLTFAYKKQFRLHKLMPALYPLAYDKNYFIPQLTCNSYRHNDGENGNREIIMPKPEKQIRIVCLGDSIMGNYISYNNKNYSCPLELERYLTSKISYKNLVVHNCAHGGWTSADVLINFELNIFDTKPDIIIIYQAYNDIRASLVPGFQTDYSHCMRNIGEKYIYYKFVSLIPNFPLAFYNFIVNQIYPYMNPRHGVLRATARGKQNFDNEFVGVSTYIRNIEYILKICKDSNIKVILSTYAHYLHDKIKDSKIHQKYHEGIIVKNEQLKKLGCRYNIPVVDIHKLVPQNEDFFVDCIHFSPKGMKFFAEKVGQEIETSIGSLSKE